MDPAVTAVKTVPADGSPFSDGLQVPMGRLGRLPLDHRSNQLASWAPELRRRRRVAQNRAGVSLPQERKYASSSVLFPRSPIDPSTDLAGVVSRGLTSLGPRELTAQRPCLGRIRRPSHSRWDTIMPPSYQRVISAAMAPGTGGMTNVSHGVEGSVSRPKLSEALFGCLSRSCPEASRAVTRWVQETWPHIMAALGTWLYFADEAGFTITAPPPALGPNAVTHPSSVCGDANATDSTSI